VTANPSWEPRDRERFRLRFDEDVEAFDRTRPVAPSIVFDELVELAGLQPGASIVEIGPGTGQATLPLAARGLRIVALEPGRHLAERARLHLATFPDVEVLTTSFESWKPGSARFDAVFACNSFHWVDPAVRFHKSAQLLEADGHLVVLATPWVVPEDAERFWWDVQDDYVAAGYGRIDPATQHPDRVGDVEPTVRASGLFEEPLTRRHRFDVTYSADDYAALLATQTGTKEAPPAAQAALVELVRRRIEDTGGAVTAHLLALLTVARVRAR
jgi:SAM-dependent methyltransferase